MNYSVMAMQIKINEFMSNPINDPSKVWSYLPNEELINYRSKVDWSGIQLNHQYYNYLVTGNPAQHYLSYYLIKYISDPVSVLSLGCGNGQLERCPVGFSIPYKHIVEIYLNNDLIKYAISEAKRQRHKIFSNFVGDLNKIVLPKSKFDLV
jgi:SAM-dependent methyltransferase